MTNTNVAVVRDFLESVAASDSAAASSLLAPEVVWRNRGLPTLRGERVHSIIRDMERRGIGFGVEIHAIAAQGDQVLTDRTDYLWKGPVKTGFWVRGTFVVSDGLITLWDDAFSLGNFLKGFVTR